MEFDAKVSLTPITISKAGKEYRLLKISVVDPLTGEYINLSPQRTNMSNIGLLTYLEELADANE
jgi:hypothetical protein